MTILDMEKEAIAKLFNYIPPQYSCFVLILIAVGFLVYKFTSHFNESKKVHKEFPEIKEDVREIKTEIIIIKKDISEIKSTLADQRSNPTLAMANSPLRLSPEGDKLFFESGAAELLKREYTSWVKELEERNLNSALDVQRESYMFLFGKSKEIIFKSVKDFVYEHPVYNGNNLSLSDVIFVMSLKLRDKYLAKHKELRDI